MLVPECTCEAILDDVAGVLVCIRVDWCPLHKAAAAMYQHISVLIPYFMSMHMDAAMSDHLLAVKAIVESVSVTVKLEQVSNDESQRSSES